MPFPTQPSKVTYKKNVFLSFKLDNKRSSYEQKINLNFSPDTLTVKSITYRSEIDELTSNHITRIYTNLINDCIGEVSMPNSTTHPCNLEMSLPNGFTVQGCFNFSFIHLDNSPDKSLIGEISIILEFAMTCNESDLNSRISPIL